MNDHDLKHIYSTNVDRLNSVLDENSSELWRMIVSAKGEYDEAQFGPFWDHMESEFGIAPTVTEYGEISPLLKVIDEQKFLFFVLKYK